MRRRGAVNLFPKWIGLTAATPTDLSSCQPTHGQPGSCEGLVESVIGQTPITSAATMTVIAIPTMCQASHRIALMNVATNRMRLVAKNDSGFFDFVEVIRD